MRQINFSFGVFLLAAASLLASCNKDPFTKCSLVKSVDSTSNTTYAYNADGNVSKIVTTDQSVTPNTVSSSEYTYNADKKLVKIAETVNGAASGVSDITYDAAGLPSKLTKFNSVGALEATHFLRYSNKLLAVDSTIEVGNPDLTKATYSYDANKNLTKIVLAVSVVVVNVEFSNYDTQRNPSKLQRGVPFGTDGFLLPNSGPNNPLKTTIGSPFGSTTIVNTIAKYTDEGFPVTISSKSGTDPADIITYTYSCD